LILVDTGAFYALADRADRHHAAAASCLQDLDERLATHPLVVAETWYLLESRLGRHAARRFADQLALGRLDLLPVEAADYAAALVIQARSSLIRAPRAPRPGAINEHQSDIVATCASFVEARGPRVPSPPRRECKTFTLLRSAPRHAAANAKLLHWLG